MRHYPFIVKWSKYFTSGHLQGIMLDCQLGFPTLETASEHVGWLISHQTKPVVSAIDKTEYTCHMSRIETNENYEVSK